ERVDVPQTIEDLKENNIDVDPNSQLYELMKKSEKIIYNSNDRTFQYK
ncbi:11047_t:CDS:1, partial [Racocetra fulgida]